MCMSLCSSLPLAPPTCFLPSLCPWTGKDSFISKMENWLNVYWDHQLQPHSVAKTEPCVLFIFSPTSSRDRHCLFQVTLGSAGAEHITLFPASSAEGPRCASLPPTMPFASKLSKLGKCTHIKRSSRRFRHQTPYGGTIVIQVKTTSSMQSLCQWLQAHSWDAFWGPRKWHSHQQLLNALLEFSLQSHRKEGIYFTYPEARDSPPHLTRPLGFPLHWEVAGEPCLQVSFQGGRTN